MPITYWLSISIVVVFILSGLYNIHKRLTYILILTALNLLASTAFEMAHHVDVYLHTSMVESISLYKLEEEPPKNRLYATTFPTLTIFTSIFKQILDIDIILITRLFEYFFSILVGLILYVTVSRINKHNTFLISLSFPALVLTTFHLSPSTLAYLYYAIIIYAYVSIILYEKYVKPYLLLLFIIISILPMTNPTFDYYALLISLLLLVSLYIKRTDRRKFFIIFTISILMFVSIISWIIYRGEEIGIKSTIRAIDETAPLLPLNPSYSRLIYNYFEYFIIGSVLIILVSSLIIAIKRLNNYGDYKINNLMTLLIVLAISPFIFLVIAVETSDISFVIRNYGLLLIVLPLIIAVTNFFVKNSKIIKILMIIVVIGIIIQPISRWGLNPHIYSPASSLFMSNFLLLHTDGTIIIISPTRDIYQLIYYYTPYHRSSDVWQIDFRNYIVDDADYNVLYQSVVENLQKSLSNPLERNRYSIVSKHASNNIASAYKAYDYINYVNERLAEENNILSDAGSIKLYRYEKIRYSTP
ncbi:MAG: hypothetical protein QXO37_09205 [Candidatus Nitrosocaldaceae archaeon]